jgi:polygalacturonase
MAAVFNIRDFGAKGDGVTVDTPAIRAAIEAAAQAGGSEVVFPAGHYLSFSIPLQSGVHLYLAEGCVLEAADPAIHNGAYDLPEPHIDLYQDFGHSHWRNSLIYGIEVEDVSITGPGTIDGKGMTREGPGSQWSRQRGEFPLSMKDMSAEEMAILVPEIAAMNGQGNKAIAFYRSRNLVFRDFTIARGGHFAILTTGCDDLVFDNLRVDSNRDGLDIDGCRRVVVRGCRVNTPNDDAIVLKASFACGEIRHTEDVTVEDCHVSGFDPGTLIDGTKGRTQTFSPDLDRVTGRIKIGTETNGDFRNIVIRNCTFERSRGLALETVDGGTIENVRVENLTMRDVQTAPLFIRLGARLRGPEGTKPGAVRDVVIRDVTAEDCLADYAALLVGLPDRPIEGVTLENIRLSYRGGGTAGDAARVMPENADSYPEPSMFGRTPAFGLWTRDVKGLSLRNVECLAAAPDARPAMRFERTEMAEEKSPA